MSKHLHNVLDIIHSCVNSSFTGQLIINFNNGGVCQPMYKTGKGDVNFDKNGFTGKITEHCVNGEPKVTIDIQEEIWFNKR
jgi:hypothetical protein